MARNGNGQDALDSYLLSVPEQYEVDQSDIDRANAIIGQLSADGHDLDWISSYDVKKLASYEPGESYSYKDKSGILAVPNKAYAAIWELEILGQISDGAWENYWVDDGTPGLADEYNDYFELKVVVDKDLDAPELRDATLPVALNYLDRLTEYDAQIGRLLFYARYSGNDIDEDKLRQMLTELGRLDARAQE